MKVKKLFLPALAAVTLLASCSKDGPDEPVNPVDMTGKAYLSLSLKNNNEAMTRSNEQKPGTEAESKADRVTVLLFDDAFLCLGTADFSGLTVGNSGGSNTPTAEKSEAKLVPGATKKIFVVINPVSSNGWDLTDNAVKGKSWQDINTTIKDANLTIGNLTATNSFMMTSAGNQTYGATHHRGGSQARIRQPGRYRCGQSPGKKTSGGSICKPYVRQGHRKREPERCYHRQQ